MPPSENHLGHLAKAARAIDPIEELRKLSHAAKGELRHLLAQPLTIINLNAEIMIAECRDKLAVDKGHKIKTAVARINKEIGDALGVSL